MTTVSVLLPHPTTNAAATSTQLEVEIQRSDSLLHLKYQLRPSRAVVLPTQEPVRQHDLWRATCFEVFVARRGEPSYWEVNAAPGGAWNVYAFDDERQGMREEERIDSLRVERRWRATRRGEPGRLVSGPLEIEIELSLEQLGIGPEDPLDLGLSAVLELEGVGLTYWARAHPSDQPDFHRRDGWGPGPEAQ
ncbi:MAG: DOMON-like domain-containing protein [Acidobacteriota bacterium]